MEIKTHEENIRLDIFLKEKLNQNRSQITKMIKNKEVTVNGKIPKPGLILKKSDIVKVDHTEEDSTIKPEKMDLDIVYEDDDVIVVNKQNGVVVHPAPGHYKGTLVNGLLYHTNLSDLNGEIRPGIVHRIDAYTTGLLMVAKNNKAHEKLGEELKDKKTKRKYIALVWGVIKNDTGEIDAPIGRSDKDRKKMAINPRGKTAITHFKVLERFKNATLIELTLETGRTHQIRVHMDYINHPVVNDPVYGNKKLLDDTGQLLHAKTIGFTHPKTGKYMEFDSKLPKHFEELIQKFREGDIDE